MKNVLITGVSSGIGKELAKIYIENQFNVFGVDIKELSTEEFTFFQADITNEDNLLEIFNKLYENSISLDMIINVAGIHKMASLVESDFNMMKKVIDINLCGTMLVNKIFHPLLKAKGKVVIITSEVASFDPLPFNGLYNVSKSALDTYAQALRQELNLLDQKVITIRPGAIETELSNNSLTDTERLANTTILYKKQSHKFLHFVKKFTGTPMKPEKLAEFIYKVSLKKHPKYIYKKHQNIGLVLLSILPKSLQCFIIKSLLNTGKESN